MSEPYIYYQDEQATIWCGDCRDVLPRLEHADLIISDPPYGIGEHYLSFDDTKSNLANLVKECVPLFKRSATVTALTPGVGNLFLYPAADWTLCWSSSAGVGSGPWGYCCWQPILVYGNDPYLKAGLGRRPDLFESNDRAEKNGHPCPKPLSVWKWVIVRTSYKPRLIIDPMMGSGTTLRVAKDFGERAIGIDIEERYCAIAADRLSQSVLNFDPPPPHPRGIEGEGCS